MTATRVRININTLEKQVDKITTTIMALNASAKATLASKKIALDAWNDDWEVLADVYALILRTTA